MSNYFNTLSLREQLAQLGQCRFMDTSEFTDGVEALKGLKIVIIGCGAQGLNQGLNMRDSGLDISYALREGAIKEKRVSYQNAVSSNFHGVKFKNQRLSLRYTLEVVDRSYYQPHPQLQDLVRNI